MAAPQDPFSHPSYTREPIVFDGKRMRKAIKRRYIDYNATAFEFLLSSEIEGRRRDRKYLQFHPAYERNWTPNGRRLITGSSNGEFTLWNGFSYNFETILQAHDTAVRSLKWSHNGKWMLSTDHSGYVKYWQSNMNNVKMFQAHKEAVRGTSFAPSDRKFVTCSDDSLVRLWDFATCEMEVELTGHRWDVKTVAWHPEKALIASGSKDNLILLWDAKSGKNIFTLHGHRSRILSLEWNRNGNWLLSGAGDQFIKCFDIRNLKEMRSYRIHSREVTSVDWHPFHEQLFASGGFEGAIHYFSLDEDAPVGSIENAHESGIWDIEWHPLGHVLCSGSTDLLIRSFLHLFQGSNDHSTKFWCRNRPGSESIYQGRGAKVQLGEERDVLDSLKDEISKEKESNLDIKSDVEGIPCISDT